MKSIHTMMPAAAALSTLAFVALAAPAAQAGFCSVDSSFMRSCGYATLEQCHAMVSGKNGTCMVDPFSDDANAKLKGASNALAHQPTRAHKHRRAQ